MHSSATLRQRRLRVRRAVTVAQHVEAFQGWHDAHQALGRFDFGGSASVLSLWLLLQVRRPLTVGLNLLWTSQNTINVRP